MKNVVNFSIKPGKLKELVQLMEPDDTKYFVQNFEGGDTFTFTYDVRESSKLKHYQDPGHDVEYLRAGSSIAVEIQIHWRNLKATKKGGQEQGVLISPFRYLFS